MYEKHLPNQDTDYNNNRDTYYNHTDFDRSGQESLWKLHVKTENTLR